MSYRAILCERLGPPETLRLVDLTRPALPPGFVRLAVRAAGLNFPDLLMIEGRYQHRPPLPFVPGLEAAGEVIEVGSGVTGTAVGERVMARMRTGGYAEEAVVRATDVVPLPAGFSFAEGATFLAAHTTAWHALVSRANLQRGETLLVLGAAGGVGLAAVETGALRGARVIAVASTDRKRQAALAKGAAETVDGAKGTIAMDVKALTGDRGADVILDPVGLAQDEALRALAVGGRLLIAGFAAGTIPAYAANRVLLKGATLIGIRAGEAGRLDPDLRRLETDAIVAEASAGRLRPHVSAENPLAACAQAMQLLSQREAIGRVALRMG